MTRTRLAALLAIASLLVLALASTASAADGKTRAATRLLRGTQWTTYQSGYATGATQDRVIHLCSGGRFVVISNFVSTYVEGSDSSSYDHPYGESRITGRWKVVRASFGAGNRSARALVRYVTDDGGSGTVLFAAGPRGMTVGGAPAETGRSSMCR